MPPTAILIATCEPGVRVLGKMLGRPGVATLTPYIVLVVCLLVLPAKVHARTEWVFVAKIVSDDKAIVERRNGQAYLIEKGVGCLSLWRKEGDSVIVNSPGLFLGVGSSLILPDEGQECRIWDAEELGGWQAPAQPEHQNPVVVLQLVLKSLGYDPGPPDGVVGPKTKAALQAFQRAEQLPETGQADEATVNALIANLEAAGVPLPGPSPEAASPGCETGHWVSEVIGNGAFVRLEDGSLWEVDLVGQIDTMLWLPVEDVITCGGAMLINADTGDRVAATRIR